MYKKFLIQTLIIIGGLWFICQSDGFTIMDLFNLDVLMPAMTLFPLILIIIIFMTTLFIDEKTYASKSKEDIEAEADFCLVIGMIGLFLVGGYIFWCETAKNYGTGLSRLSSSLSDMIGSIKFGLWFLSYIFAYFDLNGKVKKREKAISEGEN